MQMFIGGEWVDAADGQTMESIDPATREPLTVVPSAGADDVDRAVNAARAAYESEQWQDMLPSQRGRLLNRLAADIRANADELARWETLDAGKPLAQSRADVEVAARYCEYYAGVADKLLGETIPVRPDLLDYTLREPLGVTAHIVPWNYPLQIAVRGLAPALAAGNAVVLKPADETPVTALKIAELIERSEWPSGLVNIVTGTGPRVGASLAAHPGINHVTFTGSVPTGIAVMRAAAGNVTPVTLELGGKSPNIVFADADLDEAADWVVKSIIQNAGQTCSAGSRLIVERAIHETFVERVVERMKALTLGAGIDEPDIGPIISQKQLNTIESYMELACGEGVTIRTGGRRATSPPLDRGFFFEPTVIDGLSADHRLAREEIFGPVLSVIEFDDARQAIEIANDTDYGLITGVWTTNVHKALWLAGQIRCGQVYVNNYGAGGGVELPFGGYGKSGFGREKGLEALRGYTQLKNVAVRIKPNAR
ncbi:aldehyde dehydrogenase family protein [Salinisphaera sp. T31B1]|uniref:aldehyde dehydrogenase family protein n=1 Tax=Salinisphaera sp. T31B1 TaxID=727963 RepID=UPI00333FC9C1